MTGAPIASRLSLMVGSVIDGALLIFLSYWLFPLLARAWELISGAPVEAPVIGFMSDYSQPAQNGWWLIVFLAVAAVMVLLPASSRLLGASPGRALLGIRYTDGAGHPAPLGRVLLMLKSAFNLGLLLLVLLPGPILGFALGPAADVWSLVALALGLALALWILLGGGGVPRIYAWAGIEPRLRETPEDAP